MKGYIQNVYRSPNGNYWEGNRYEHRWNALRGSTQAVLFGNQLVYRVVVRPK